MSKSGRATGSVKLRKSPVVVRAPRRAPDIETLDEAMDFLLARTDVERLNPARVDPTVWKLDRMRALLKALGDPHASVRFVHVAGTKGKGSTSEMIASCLEGCGYAVGLFTSPHLVDVRERLRIGRRMIGPEEFIDLTRRVGKAAGSIAGAAEADGGGEATFFELITAMGLLYFKEQAVDVAVIEVGLGGRLDSTNVIIPEVSVVTSISRDHWQILGDSLEAIAREKAGIFKPGIPAITIDQKPGVVEAMREVAATVQAPFAVVGKDVDFSMRFEASSASPGGNGVGRSAGGGGPHTKVCLTTERVNYEHLVVPLKGEHQALNCGLALAALDRLVERGFKCPETGVARGLAAVTLPGRLEVVPTIPRLILDGAHNRESVKCLIKAIGQHVPYDSMVFIFGCATDKDVDGMLAELALGADKVIFTRTTSARSADPRDLARKYIDHHNKMAQVAEDFTAALSIAKRAVTRDDLICVTGSFYLVGEAKKHLATLKRS